MYLIDQIEVEDKTINMKTQEKSRRQVCNNHKRHRRSSNAIDLTHCQSISKNRKRYSCMLLYASVVVMVNLCPFNQDSMKKDLDEANSLGRLSTISSHNDDSGNKNSSHMNLIIYFNKCLSFMQNSLMILSEKKTRFTQADAAMLGKMAKIWYIKKKIKKLSKKLKKHTIAVPVFTAIPIYEHSYYPQPHVSHVSHGGHHAAASSYSAPAILAANTAIGPSAAGQLATSASNTNQNTAYRLPMPALVAPHHHHHHHPAVYQSTNAAGSAATGAAVAAPHIINGYAASSPSLYVDESGGLYGHYGNAYGRYDGGYQMW